MVSNVASALVVTQARPGRTALEQTRWLQRRIAVTDLVAVCVAVFGSQWAWLGLNSGRVAVFGQLDRLFVDYILVSASVCAVWLVMLAIDGTRSIRVLGSGPTEFRLVLDATMQAFAGVAIAFFLLQFDVSRGYILLAFPVGLVTLLATRAAWRRWLWTQRRADRMCERVLLVGHEEASLRIARDLAAHPQSGYRIVGACTPTGGDGFLGDSGIPLYGSTDRVESAIALTGVDTVVVSSGERLPAERIREISWALESGRQHLVVATSLVDIGGPRMHLRPAAGLPLVHVETPRYSGRERVIKRAFDIVASVSLIVVLAPVLLVLAVIVRATSEGPALYRQERVGIQGRPFQMVKFRSMRKDADGELAALLAAQGTDGQPLFKVDDDPRITRIGRVLRRYSLDELPQLFNVLDGSMSLVGPRPQRAGEVALYDDAARRRLIVKPGMSGLWQVSGRSALTWEQTVRLDLYYVENWSLASDLSILLRTAKAVVAPGATAR